MMKFFCLLANLAIYATFCGNLNAAEVCPTGYDCPTAYSTDGCMVLTNIHTNNGRPKFHSGCFVANMPELKMDWNADHCASFCNEDSGCKGFSFGKEYYLSTKRGCLLATDRTDCESTWGYKQFPDSGNSNVDLAVVGELMEEPNAPPRAYGFTGCYKKKKVNMPRL